MEIRENEYLVLVLPAYSTAYVFRVVEVLNKGFEKFEYGPLPIKKDDVFNSLDGGTVTAPEDGVIPKRSYSSISYTFPYTNNPPGRVPDKNDMWFISKENRDKLFIITLHVKPEVIRLSLEIPQGIKQLKFHSVVAHVYGDFGFSRGRLTWVQIPGVHVGINFANFYNIDFYTYSYFIYKDLTIEIPKDPGLIFDILVGKVKAHWFTLPLTTTVAEFDRVLEDVYGFRGFKLYPAYERDKAINEYKKLLEVARV